MKKKIAKAVWKADEDIGLIYHPVCQILCRGHFAFNVLSDLLRLKAIKIVAHKPTGLMRGTKPKIVIYDELVKYDEKDWARMRTIVDSCNGENK